MFDFSLAHNHVIAKIEISSLQFPSGVVEIYSKDGMHIDCIKTSNEGLIPDINRVASHMGLITDDAQMDIFFEFTVPLYDSVKHRTKAKQKKLRFATPDVIYEKTDSPKENIDISKKKDILSSQNQTSFF